MPNKPNFDIEDAFQHTAFVPETAFKEDLQTKLRERYRQQHESPSASKGSRRFSMKQAFLSLPERLFTEGSSRLFPAFSAVFIMLLVIVLGAAVMLPSFQQYATGDTATPSVTTTDSTSPTEEGTAVITLTPEPQIETPTDSTQETETPIQVTATVATPTVSTPTVTPTPSTPTPTVTISPTPSPDLATTEPTIFVGCSETRLSGAVDVAAPFVRATVSLASNLSTMLAEAVVPVSEDGTYLITMTYEQQPVGTRLIVAVGEWDGTQYLEPVMPFGEDCVES